jgi:hypothetical protein
MMLGGLTADVLVHTWDLARAAGLDPALDEELCAFAYDGGRAAGLGAASAMYHAAVPTRTDADLVSRLIALHGRDPEWEPPAH